VTAAGQDDVRHVFATGGDTYVMLATAMYGRDITKADKNERQVGKVGVLSCGFGAGAGSIATQLKKAKAWTDDDQPAKLVETYRAVNYHVVKAWRECNRMLDAMRPGRMAIGQGLELGHMQEGMNAGHAMFRMRKVADDAMEFYLPSGRCLTYRGMVWGPIEGKDRDGWSYLGHNETPDGRIIPARIGIYGGKLFQNFVQATARDVIGYAAWLMKTRYGLTMAGQGHDELSYVVPESQGDAVRRLVESSMTTAPSWMPGLPLACESAIGYNYGQV
jgi:DNA polymerase bacteriophage-type